MATMAPMDATVPPSAWRSRSWLWTSASSASRRSWTSVQASRSAATSPSPSSTGVTETSNQRSWPSTVTMRRSTRYADPSPSAALRRRSISGCSSGGVTSRIVMRRRSSGGYPRAFWSARFQRRMPPRVSMTSMGMPARSKMAWTSAALLRWASSARFSAVTSFEMVTISPDGSLRTKASCQSARPPSS